jgi:molybdopterin-guanine dinucleotide biosynthesis protein
MTRTIIAVGGFSSGVGKTTVMCELLRAFPGWEAIKMTRGHYRSCGKDPHACCVSHLLSDEPVIRAGRPETYVPAKDTGRYWDAGASNVQWVIVTDAQVEEGIKRALERTKAPGVFVEGTSFQQFVRVDFAVMVARPVVKQLKPSARRALHKADALYLFDDELDGAEARAQFLSWQQASAAGNPSGDIPVYTRDDLPRLVSAIEAVHTGVPSVECGLRIAD